MEFEIGLSKSSRSQVLCSMATGAVGGTVYQIKGANSARDPQSMSRSQKAMGTTESTQSRVSQSRGRDSTASDAVRSSRDNQFETDWFGRLRAAAFSHRVRGFTLERYNGIPNQPCFLVAPGSPDQSRTEFGTFSMRWA